MNGFGRTEKPEIRCHIWLGETGKLNIIKKNLIVPFDKGEAAKSGKCRR